MQPKKNGRPTKYKPEYAERMEEFFSIDEPSYRESANKQGTIQMVARRMPTMERFALGIGVTVGTLWNWANKTKKDSEEPVHPEFLEAYTRARDCQMVYILEAGVVGALNSPFLNLFMKNAHGWQDKIEQEVTHAVSIDLDEINRELDRAAEKNKLMIAELEAKGEIGKFTT